MSAVINVLKSKYVKIHRPCHENVIRLAFLSTQTITVELLLQCLAIWGYEQEKNSFDESVYALVVSVRYYSLTNTRGFQECATQAWFSLVLASFPLNCCQICPHAQRILVFKGLRETTQPLHWQSRKWILMKYLWNKVDTHLLDVELLFLFI